MNFQFSSADLHSPALINTDKKLDMKILSNYILPLRHDEQYIRGVCYARRSIDLSLMKIYIAHNWNCAQKRKKNIRQFVKVPNNRQCSHSPQKIRKFYHWNFFQNISNHRIYCYLRSFIDSSMGRIIWFHQQEHFWADKKLSAFCRSS